MILRKHPIAAALMIALGAFAGTSALAEWQTATGLTVNTSRLYYSPSTRGYFARVSLTNTSDSQVSGALRVAVTGSFPTPINEDGTNGDGQPFYYLVTNDLAPGETSETIRVDLGSGRRGRKFIDLAAEVDPDTFTMQLLHVADIDGKGPQEDVRAFSALVDHFSGLYPNNTLKLSSGDNWIPGVEYSAASVETMDRVLGVAGDGRAHVAYLNAMGFQASAMGNHDLDGGPGALVGIISPETDGGTWEGALFPYLSANLDFAADADLIDLVVADGQPASSVAGKLAGSVTIDVNGETVGIVGATTPNLASITSTGNIGVAPADSSDIDALAAIIQDSVDALTATGIDKIIVLAHMQQIGVEQQLAARLSDVDVIVAGGSNTRLLDGDDLLYPGDLDFADTYPLSFTTPKGEPIYVVNTDGDYKYLGRLVAGFDALGRIVPSTLDEALNGAWASSAASLARVGLTGAADQNADVDVVADALDTEIALLEANFFGFTSVYLDGIRGSVRTEETNLGNLTADANLWLGRIADPSVQVSIKNGGGIRDAIGSVVCPPGSVDPSECNALPPDEGKINQIHVQNALRFNNGLTLLTLTKSQLLAVLEETVQFAAPGVTSGNFGQVAGVRFSWDQSLPAGSRVVNAAVVDDSGAVVEELVRDGSIAGDPSSSFRVITLNFLVDSGYDSLIDAVADGGSDRVDLVGSGMIPDGVFDFADPGSEQDALAEYLSTYYFDVPFDTAEVEPIDDIRNQQLALAGKVDTVFDLPEGAVSLAKIGGLTLGGAEIVSYDPDAQKVFVTGGSVAVVDISTPSTPVLDYTLDVEADVQADISGFNADSVTSVSYKDGLLVAALPADADLGTDADPGYVAFYDDNGAYLGAIEAGALPDMVTWDRGGNRVLVANEGEGDAEGSLTVIDVPTDGDAASRVASATATQIDFQCFNGSEADLRLDGVRIFPAQSAAMDFEPEYIALSADDGTAYVALQEANTLAEVDLTGTLDCAAITLIPLGTKDHSLLANALDSSDKDGVINIQPRPVQGLYMPDGISAYDPGVGRTFVLTANEGDDRGDFGDDGPLADAVRIKDLALDATAFPDAAALQEDDVMGRLNVSAFDGNTGAGGTYETLFSYGARSFTIWDMGSGSLADSVVTGIVGADSNDDIGQVTAQLTPAFFNANDGDPGEFDKRSDNKGAEPEAVITGEIDGRYYAFVGLERAAGGVMIYDVTNPALPSFESYTPGVTATENDIALEGMVFISAEQSPNGNPLLVTANEESKTVAIYEIE